MTKTHKIIYWIATIWMAVGMVSTAIVQLFNVETKNDFITHLGYPSFALTIIGAWKLLGVAAILIPGYPLLKEWAYAGFFFVMSGALVSHIAHGDAANEIFPSILLLMLTIVSWYFRPPSRKLISIAR